jgi:hypothetical protein
MGRAGIFLSAALAALSLRASAEATPPSSADKPSPADVQRAMDDAFGQQIRDRTDVLLGDCMAVRELQCSPARHGRSTCTYAYEHRRGTAVLKRNADESWRWLSGPYHCTIGVLSKWGSVPPIAVIRM